MFFLAWRHVLYNRAISVLLIAGLTLVIAFPIVVSRAARVAEEVYGNRARATPLVVGRRANEHQLTLNTLYFEGPKPPPVPQKLVADLRDKHAGLVLPISNRLTAGGFPLIGTVTEYFDFRALQLDDGELPMLLGDCVVGSVVAQKLNLKTGGSLRTDISSFLNVAHDYPFKLNVTGILKSNGTPDDRAVFTDIKTVWTVEGLGHGHDNVIEHAATITGPSAPSPEAVNAQVQAILGKGVVEFREVTSENIRSFHFHGDEKEFPLTAIIVAPSSDKSGTMLKGAINAGDEYEAVVPDVVIAGLMKLVFNVKKIFDTYFVMTALGVFAFLAIVVLLTLRNRRDEFSVMVKMGCSRNAIGSLFAYEFMILFAVSGMLSVLISQAAIEAIRHFAL
ncbi:MAG: FtsX-like permease family protein [Planctomycetota bacterium]